MTSTDTTPVRVAARPTPRQRADRIGLHRVRPPRRTAGAPTGRGSGRRSPPPRGRQALEGHVPQPARVGPVGDARVDADHQRARRPRRPGPAARSSPAGFLASMSRARTPRTTRVGEAPRHLRHRRHGAPTRRRRRCPCASAATAAISALAWLKRPGSASAIGVGAPVGPPPAIGRSRHRLAASAGRRVRPAGSRTPVRSAHRAVVGEGDPARRTTGTRPHRGASPGRHRPSAPGRAAPAPHTTSGSSALATTVVCGAAASAARQRPATMRTSLVRSSWSRDRFSSTTRRRRRWRPAPGAGRSRRPRARPACAPRGRRASAATCPGGMFEPVSLLTTASPSAPSATVSRRVVVVLPLVPVTSATSRPAVRCSQQLRVDPQAGPPAGHRALAHARAGATSALTARVVSEGEPQPHAGGLVRASSSAVGSWRTRDSSGSKRADGRHDRLGVGLGVGQATAAPGGPTAHRDLRRMAHQREVGHPGRTGPHLLGAPQPDRDHRRAASPRPAGPSPSCPCSSGSKKASPRGMVPCGSTITTSPAFKRGLGRPQRLVRPAAAVDRRCHRWPGRSTRRPARRRSPSCPGSAPAARLARPPGPAPPRRSSCGGSRPAAPGPATGCARRPAMSKRA